MVGQARKDACLRKQTRAAQSLTVVKETIQEHDDAVRRLIAP